MDFTLINALPAEVVSLLREDAAEGIGLADLVSHLLGTYRIIGTSIRDGAFSSDKVGTENTFGDDQLEVDVKSDKVIFDALKESGCVHTAASEESPKEVNYDGVVGLGYSVAFDPLDGSSIFDCNFAVGSIVGIWPGVGLLNRKGSEQCASMVAQYGPRVTVALAFNSNVTKSGNRISLELTMMRNGWNMSNPQFSIRNDAKTFAPGNLRATVDNPAYKALIDHYITNGFTLRYSGGLVPDIYHILTKGQGILTNASSPKAKAKLRLLFEAAPIALIIEAAGGSSCVCASEAAEEVEPTSILDVVATDMDKRIGVAYGSIDEITRFRKSLFSM